MNNIIKRVWIRNRMANIDYLGGSAFCAEDGGHTFQISGVDENGDAFALSGTVAGIFLRPDNTDVAITGSVSGGVVSVTLPADCYDVPGQFGLTIYLTEGGQRTAIYAAVGNVARTSSGVAAPQITANVIDLINRISEVVATIPASWTGLMADIAPTYSASAVYPAGAHVYYNGDLYRCTTTITTAEPWTPAHWTPAVLGQDVSDLGSAISQSIALYTTKKIVYNYSTKVITFPSSGFYFYKGVARANIPSHEIDLSSILTNDACTFWIDQDYSITATPWNTRPNNKTAELIGWLYDKTVSIYGVPDRNIQVVDGDGKTIFLDLNTQGSFIAESSGLTVIYDIGTKVLSLPQSFCVYRGVTHAFQATDIDLSEVDDSGIYRLWLTPDGVLYGTAWSGSNVERNGNDDCIGYIFNRIVHINGIPWHNIKVKRNSLLDAGNIFGNGMIGLRDNQKVIYDYYAKTLTIPTGFSVYRGSGMTRATIVTLDLTNILANDACKLFLQKDGTIYATKWSQNEAEDCRDQLVGYIYNKNVYINGVNEDQITVLDVSPSSTLRVFCFGDSITAGVGTSKLYHMYFHEWLPNYHFYNWAIGSTGFLLETNKSVCVGNGVEGDGSVRQESGNNTIIKVMQSIDGEMPNIIIAAGTNDYGASKPIANFRTAVQDVLDLALTKTNHIFVITPIKRNGWDTNTNSLGLHLSDYADVIKEECELRGIVCFTGFDVDINPTNEEHRIAFMPDGLHPNEDGHARIARACWSKFLESIYEVAEYSATSAYSAGDYCLYLGVLYRCITAIASGGEPWNPSHWTAVGFGPDVFDLNTYLTLQEEVIQDTVQTITFDSSGNVQQITHVRNGMAVRTDVFTFAASTITEVRTLAAGESLTIVTNTDTLETTTTYADAV